MIDLLITIFIMSLVCCGAHVVIMDDLLFKWKGYDWQAWTKPFFYCCRCMASLWGGAVYILLTGGIDLLIIPCIIATAFLNSVFISYYYSKT